MGSSVGVFALVIIPILVFGPAVQLQQDLCVSNLVTLPTFAYQHFQILPLFIREGDHVSWHSASSNSLLIEVLHNFNRFF